MISYLKKLNYLMKFWANGNPSSANESVEPHRAVVMTHVPQTVGSASSLGDDGANDILCIYLYFTKATKLRRYVTGGELEGLVRPGIPSRSEFETAYEYLEISDRFQSSRANGASS